MPSLFSCVTAPAFAGAAIVGEGGNHKAMNKPRFEDRDYCLYIISDDRTKSSPQRCVWYVAAPPGFYRRKADGKIVRDKGISCARSGPEWTINRSEALEFKSCRAAMRVANKCTTAKVHPI